MITSDRCHNYGIGHGCDENCPALLDGECRNVEDALEHCDLPINEKLGIKYKTISLGYSNEGKLEGDE